MNIFYLTTESILSSAFQDTPQSRKEYFLQKRSSGFRALIEHGHEVYLVDGNSFDAHNGRYSRGVRLVEDELTKFGLSPNTVELPVPDFCWQRRHFEGSENFACLNPKELIEVTSSQVSTYELLARLGFRNIVEFVAIHKSSSDDEISVSLRNCLELFEGDKLVVKKAKGFAGSGVMVVTKEDLSLDLLAGLARQSDLLVEPYIESDHPEGYRHGVIRVMIAGTADWEVVVGAFWRLSRQSEMTKGREDIFVYDRLRPELLKSASDIALGACIELRNHLKLEQFEVGVDMIIDDGTPRLLEINSGPIRLSTLNAHPVAKSYAESWDTANVRIFDQQR